MRWCLTVCEHEACGHLIFWNRRIDGSNDAMSRCWDATMAWVLALEKLTNRSWIWLVGGSGRPGSHP